MKILTEKETTSEDLSEEIKVSTNPENKESLNKEEVKVSEKMNNNVNEIIEKIEKLTVLEFCLLYTSRCV